MRNKRSAGIRRYAAWKGTWCRKSDIENTLWLDGQPLELPPVLFKRIDAETWQIYSADGRVNLHVHTYSCHQDSTNALVVASHFHQWVGLVSGEVCLPNGQMLTWSAKLGLLEQHYARW